MAGCLQEGITGSGSIENIVQTTRWSEMVYFGLVSCEMKVTEASVSHFPSTLNSNWLMGMEMDFLFLNPGGEQLSSEYAPLPKVYIFVSLLWIVPTLLWMANWSWHRDQQNKLHRFITLLPFAKIIWELGAASFWQTASHYSFAEKSLVLFGLLRIVSVSMFLAVLILISRGWGICGEQNNFRDLSVTLGILIGFACCSIIGGLFQGLFEFVSIISYAFLAFLIFSFTSRTVQLLETLRDDPEAEIVGEHLREADVIDRKKSILKLFNGIMVLFCLAQVSVSPSSPFSSTYFVEDPSRGDSGIV